ncbi:hypothetical protein BDN70DRAFT_996546 [Pholiota conissans]|uniref:Uncharacterized protein n=1 Tax=Pholiota conissans TaxID=109636 RepID=A0A9P6CW20_9AGAR|nr:hypothetical protein BDN70DRAFT_996546 [Pholiota conissans]
MTRMIYTYLTAFIFGLIFVGYHTFLLSQSLGVEIASAREVKEDFRWDMLVGHRKLKWQDCYESQFQCARLLVPLNHSDPEGDQAGIALIRKRATVAPPHYRGPVLFNPGGPGESGVDLVRSAGELFSKILGPQFDIVGFDPRGVARSLPRVSSFKTELERELWYNSAGLITRECVRRAWARSHVLGKLAAENDDGYLRHINTDQTARDMLLIVEAHGQTKLQYWGFSYGSILGATFAAMFPDKIERLLIDGVADAENYYATLWSNNLEDTDKAMDHFHSGCASAGPDGCAFWAPTPEDVKKNLTALYDNIRHQPVSVRRKSRYGIVDYKTLHSAIFDSLYTPYTSFPKLAEGLAALTTGDGSIIFDMVNPKPPFECECSLPERPSVAKVEDGTIAILCNDGEDVPHDLESTKKYVEELTKSSRWGDLWARIRMDCVGWPRIPKDHFQGPFDANTSHPIMLIGNTADPVTPLRLAHKMSANFPGSAVLTQNSVGHCSIAAPSICTMKHVEDYFVNGNLPKHGTVCQPETGPFPGPLDIISGDDKGQISLHPMSEREKEIYDAVMDFIKAPAHVMMQMPGPLALPRRLSKPDSNCSKE